MAAKIFTTLTFRATTLPDLLRELTDFAGNLYEFAGNLVRDFAARPTVVSGLNPTALGFGQLHKFTLNAGEIVDTQLPRPNPLNGGLAIHITRSALTGIVVIHAVDCLVNGRSSLRLPAAPGLYLIMFDGENYYSAPALAMDWGDGL